MAGVNEMSTYTKEEIENHVAAWKEENASTGITPREYARKIGINPKNFGNWVSRRIARKAQNNEDSGCRLMKIGPIHATRFPSSVMMEFCGARIVVGDKDSMKMVLYALKEVNPT